MEGRADRSTTNLACTPRSYKAYQPTTSGSVYPLATAISQATTKPGGTATYQPTPKEVQVPCNLLITDRIPPFPLGVRTTILEKYCPPVLIPSIQSSQPDEDCLIRPYLGRRRHAKSQAPPSKFQAFSLRNFPLHIDQIKELELDATLYAQIMAETLAYLYWTAHIDANDVEFVLAPPRHDGVTTSRTIPSPVLGEHCLWLLDFDCCRAMAQDESGVRQAVEAFWTNDPFCPRPGREDGRDGGLWRVFRERFLGRIEGILGREGRGARLPGLWVELVEGRC